VVLHISPSQTETSSPKSGALGLRPPDFGGGVLGRLHYNLGVMDTHPQAPRGITTTECFLDFSRTKLVEQYWPRLRRAVEPLSEARVRWRPNSASNSIGNILGKTMDEAASVLARLTKEDLLASYAIQGYTVTGLAAVYQVVEHFGMHYGQILYISKMLEGGDLGFYSELNKTGRAS
jgi:hypothetical protein